MGYATAVPSQVQNYGNLHSFTIIIIIRCTSTKHFSKYKDVFKMISSEDLGSFLYSNTVFKTHLNRTIILNCQTFNENVSRAVVHFNKRRHGFNITS
jgi:hypothetical protein